MVYLKDWDAILCSAHYFLCGINAEKKLFEFVKSSRDQLSRPSFIDGRVSLSDSSDIYQLPIAYCLDWYRSNNNKILQYNFIFHMGFCGSTLMARSLDIPSICFTYKEPQALIDMSELHMFKDSFIQKNAELITSFVLQQYNLSFTGSERNIIKPSNWVNSMIPALISDSHRTKAVFLSIDLEDFLIAVFRGGEARIQYVLNMLKHMNNVVPIFNDVILKIETEEKDMVARFIKLVLLTHTLQNEIFVSSSAKLPKENQIQCSYKEFIYAPTTVLDEVSSMLDLNLSDYSIQNSVKANLSKHSKVTNRDYDTKSSENINQQVINYYNIEFQKGLKWHREHFDKRDMFI